MNGIKDIIKNMHDQHQKHPVMVGIADVLNFIGGITGAIALATTVFYTGAVVEKLRALDVYTRDQFRIIDSRVANIERDGSTPLKDYTKYTDERIEQIRDEMRLMRDALITINSVDRKVEVLTTKMDLLKAEVSTHVQKTDTKVP